MISLYETESVNSNTTRAAAEQRNNSALKAVSLQNKIQEFGGIMSIKPMHNATINILFDFFFSFIYKRVLSKVGHITVHILFEVWVLLIEHCKHILYDLI